MSSAMTIPVARSGQRLIGSVIDASTALLAQQEHDIVRFAMGAPGEDLIPVAQLDEAFAQASRGRYDYGESEGEPALREQIARLSHAAGVDTDDERILVTSGGMQGLDLAFKIFVDPGDLVLVEAPTYTNGYATARSYGADVVAAPMDENGLAVEQLPELVDRLGRTPRIIYTIPNFQNPTGTTLSYERRQLLLELAERWNTVILDDDPYGRLRFAGSDQPGFANIAPRHPLVFQVRTFSKLIAPGLRTGWIDVDPRIRSLAVNAKQAMDTCSNVPTQHALTHYLASGHLDEHLARLTPVYRERKDAMRASLERHFGDRVVSTDPEGGLFLWLSFAGAAAGIDAAGIDTERLFPDALREGVAYIPGPAFTVDGSMRNALRLCFATSSPERIELGVARLARAVERAMQS